MENSNINIMLHMSYTKFYKHVVCIPIATYKTNRIILLNSY